MRFRRLRRGCEVGLRDGRSLPGCGIIKRPGGSLGNRSQISYSTFEGAAATAAADDITTGGYVTTRRHPKPHTEAAIGRPSLGGCLRPYKQSALDRFVCSSLPNFVHPAASADARCESVPPTPYRIAASQMPMEQASFGRAKRFLQGGFKARKQITERYLGANGG